MYKSTITNVDIETGQIITFTNNYNFIKNGKKTTTIRILKRGTVTTIEHIKLWTRAKYKQTELFGNNSEKTI